MFCVKIIGQLKMEKKIETRDASNGRDFRNLICNVKFVQMILFTDDLLLFSGNFTVIFSAINHQVILHSSNFFVCTDYSWQQKKCSTVWL